MTSLFLSGSLIFIAVTLVTLIFTARIRRAGRQVSLGFLFVASAIFLVFSIITLIINRNFQFTLYHILPDLPISFLVDRLAAFFIAIISLVSASVALYSLRYGEHHGSDAAKNALISLMALFILSMIFVVASDNTFSLLFFWEVMSVTSFFLVMHEKDKQETHKSGLFYFIMTQMSTVFLFLAFLLLYRVTGSFAIWTVTASVSAGLKAILFLSLFIGFGIKAGVIPFHKWLPYAHSTSPSNISALMSGVMIKVAIYGLLRFVLTVFQPDLWWGILILVFGSVSALLGVIYALKEHDLKKLLAYSSIENIGIILLGIGLYIIFSGYNLPELALLALFGGLFHTLNHAIFKSLLFLTAGAVVEATGTRIIEEMGGLIKRMPTTGIFFLVGVVAVSALPPFNGFVSELMIFQAFFQSFRVGEPFVEILLFVALVLLALTSALAAACFVKAFGMVFLANSRSEEAAKARESPYPMLIGEAILAGMCVLLGVFSFHMFALTGYNPGIPNLLLVGALLLFFLGLAAILVAVTKRQKARISDTWGCGLTSQNSRMEYTASGFSEPILTIFSPIYRTARKAQRQFWDRSNTIFRSGEGGISTFKFFEEKLYMPVAAAVRRLSDKVAAVQDVDLDAHMLYAFVTIIVLLVLAWWIL